MGELSYNKISTKDYRVEGKKGECAGLKLCCLSKCKFNYFKLLSVFVSRVT